MRILDFGFCPPKRLADKIKNSCGFTLVELVFVAIVLGILMASAVPRLQGHWARLRTEQAAFHIAQTLRVARSLAVVQGHTVEWRWDSTMRRSRLDLEADDGRTEPIPGRIGQGRVIADPVRISVKKGLDARDRIRFFPDGTSEPAMVLISEAAVARYQIAINETTGQVTLQPVRLPTR